MILIIINIINIKNAIIFIINIIILIIINIIHLIINKFVENIMNIEKQWHWVLLDPSTLGHALSSTH